MEFHEAAEIARNHPGAVLMRDSTGTFVVRLDDGRVIRGPAEQSIDVVYVESLRRERDGILELLKEARANFEHCEKDLKEAHTNFKRREKELEAELTKLKARVAKVSQAEWARIAEEEEHIQQ